jgi:hypothetical protein
MTRNLESAPLNSYFSHGIKAARAALQNNFVRIVGKGGGGALHGDS